MEPITPEQQEQLSNWSIQRDALLGEIATLNTEKETLTQKNTELAISSGDIAKRIEQSIGRLAELDNTEKLYMEIVDSKLPSLEAEKTKLEIFISELTKEAGDLMDKKDEIKKDIEYLIKIQSEVFNRTGILEKVVEHVTKVSSSNVKELDNAVASLVTKVESVLTLSDTNIKAHTEILNEIPKLFVELSRKTLERQKI